MASRELEDITRKRALKLKVRREYPAAVVGAEYRKTKSLGNSGTTPSIMEPKLLKKINLQGGLMIFINENYLGCCAEISVSNKVLRAHRKSKSLTLGDIQFSKAIPPRTNQIVPICRNCMETFDK